MMDELEQVLNTFWKEAQTDARKVLAASLGRGLLLGLLVAGALWAWSDLSSFGSHVVPCVMWGGVVALMIWMLEGIPDPMSATAPDELLRQVAALNFVGSSANSLREILRSRGSVTIGEVFDAFQNERIARRTQQSLEQPGAKALLGN